MRNERHIKLTKYFTCTITLNRYRKELPQKANVFLSQLLIDVLELVELLLQCAALVLLLVDLLLLLHHPGQGGHLSLQYSIRYTSQICIQSN